MLNARSYEYIYIYSYVCGIAAYRTYVQILCTYNKYVFPSPILNTCQKPRQQVGDLQSCIHILTDLATFVSSGCSILNGLKMD